MVKKRFRPFQRPQTHIRTYVLDKHRIERWMKKRRIKTHAEAIRKLVQRTGL